MYENDFGGPVDIESTAVSLLMAHRMGGVSKPVRPQGTLGGTILPAWLCMLIWYDISSPCGVLYGDGMRTIQSGHSYVPPVAKAHVANAEEEAFTGKTCVFDWLKIKSFQMKRKTLGGLKTTLIK